MNKDTIFTLEEYNIALDWIEDNDDYTIKEIRNSDKGERQFCFELKYEVTHKEEIAIENRKFEIQERLSQLSQDFVQAMAGACFEDLEIRRAEFQTLHNELRVLEGKEPREYNTQNSLTNA